MSNFEKNKIEVVTVAVITYQSSATVHETLDSIVDQNYGPENIELIISDDGSKDNTVQEIEHWLVKNQARFHNVKLFVNEVNGGISKNCNIAWKAATSEWIKTIAGDDILLPNCIKKNKEYINDNPSATIVMSKMFLFKNNFNGMYKPRGLTRKERYFFSLSADRQHIYLQSRDLAGAPSSFISKKTLASIGYADERFTMIEDHPLWYKATGMGYKIYLLDDETVFYRIAESVTRSNSRLVNLIFFKQCILFDTHVISKDGRLTISRLRKIMHLKGVLFFCSKYNKADFIGKSIYFLLLLLKPDYFTNKITSYIKLISKA